MKILRFIAAILVALTCVEMRAQGWQSDVLGQGFEMRYVDQGADYSGPVRSTIVRLRSSCGKGVGILYVHGFNDYFFQAEMAREFAQHCYDFYAVDLRKYGRSIMEGQQKFQVRDLREYFADIDSAVVQMQADGISRIVLMGHSTGGLISSLYMSGKPSPAICAMILNSPFLDWNQSKLQERILIPAVRSLSGLMKSVKIPQGSDDGYARSLLRQFGGEWEYNTDWKLIHSPAVEASWIAAIDAAQDVVQNYPHIKVPVLVMHSDRSYGHAKGAEYGNSDAVLDVEDISRYGRRLGFNVTEITVRGGLHDLALSAPVVRQAMYGYVFDWLSQVAPANLP
ncbi:MAG: alpha/beta hydrolase [Muribaculaceae bacterium]|nr:alpha/beta hydrolase [Muribaculaceae bacterium]